MKIRGNYSIKSREINFHDVQFLTKEEIKFNEENPEVAMAIEEKATNKIQSLFTELFISFCRRLTPEFLIDEKGNMNFSFDQGKGDFPETELFTLKISYIRSNWDFHFILTPEGIEAVDD